MALKPLKMGTEQSNSAESKKQWKQGAKVKDGMQIPGVDI